MHRFLEKKFKRLQLSTTFKDKKHWLHISGKSFQRNNVILVWVFPIKSEKLERGERVHTVKRAILILRKKNA